MLTMYKLNIHCGRWRS